MKKIQMTSQAEVVVLNSYTVAKAARAAVAAEMFKDFLEYAPSRPGEIMEVPVELIIRLKNAIIPFVEEFAKAFEEDEKHEKSEDE